MAKKIKSETAIPPVEYEVTNDPVVVVDKTEDEVEELRCILATLVRLRINDIGELGRAIDKLERKIQGL